MSMDVQPQFSTVHP